ncbi:hypothetical protein C0992_004481 [Termitomyces sp. T32_za158]|nr:hypothetical protein C0992_004481 [Termitomyces sp. T32_za158]
MTVGQDSNYPTVNFDAWDLNAPVNTHVNVQADHKSLGHFLVSCLMTQLTNCNYGQYNPQHWGSIDCVVEKRQGFFTSDIPKIPRDNR